MGFHTDFNLAIPFTRKDETVFWDKLFVFIDAQELSIGGSMNSFYVTRAGRNTATDADREALVSWLHKQPEVSAVRVWPLDDAWHGPFKWL
jgi:uncharacterized protein YggL (DUF469 family)